jgi:predicted ATP-dependent endonuclease of OLD family
MLYAATSSSLEQSGVVLVDEPELSLHIDWQRLLINRMTKQLGDRQLVVCTHSPEIGADFEDRYQEVKPVPAMRRS